MNFGVEGPTDDPDDPHAARAPAAQLHRDAAAVAGRADAAARRRAGPHAAGQQQRLRAGQRAHLGRLGARRPAAASSSRPLWPRLRRDHPTFRRRRFFNGRPVRHGGRQRRPRHRVAAVPTARRCSPRTGTRDSGARSACSSTAAASASATAAASRSSTSTSSCCSTPATTSSTSTSRRSSSARSGTCSIDTAGEQADSEPLEPGGPSDCTRRRSWCSAEHSVARAGHRPLRRRLARRR